MTKRTFALKKGVEVTVHTQTGMDELDIDVIVYKLGNPSEIGENYRARTFARIITQTDEVKGDLGFTLASRSASAEELKASMASLLASTGGLLKHWVEELDAADEPPGDPDLSPKANPKKTA